MIEKVAEYASTIFAWLKGFKDLVTTVVFLVLLVAFFSDTVRIQFGLFVAEKYGLKAFAYYEVDGKGNLSDPNPGIETDSCGRLMLLRKTEEAKDRYFEAIKPGDRLQAADGVNLRAKPNTSSATIMILKGDSCVVALETKDANKNFEKCTGVSGGWLLVATAPCELFDRPKPFAG